MARRKKKKVNPYKLILTLGSKGTSTNDRTACKKGPKASATGEPLDPSAVSPKDDFLPDLVALAKAGQLTQSIIDQRNSVSRMESKHRMELNQDIATIVHKAYFYQTDRDEWNDFCRHPEWEGIRNRPKPDDNANPLPAVLRLACGLNKAGVKKASLLLRALQPLFNRQVPAWEIPGILEASGGVSGLAQQHRDEDKRLKEQALDGTVFIQVLRGDHSESLGTLTPNSRFIGNFDVVKAERGMIEVRLTAFGALLGKRNTKR